MPKRKLILKERVAIESYAEKFFKKLDSLKSYYALIFEIPAILLLFLEIRYISKFHIC